jgi:thiamine-phosphate pyrophosphorylase
MYGYYFITDRVLSLKGNENDVRAAVACGVKMIQYRNKNASSKEIYEEALKLKSLCINSTFIINDRVDIALSTDADGVHIGQEDLPLSAVRRLLGKDKIIGMTVHSEEDAIYAEKSGASYLGVAPIFSTKTKPDAGKPVGIELIKKIKRAVSIPVVGIGGINLVNAEEVIKAGADGICVISEVVTKPDVAAEIRKYQKLFHGH